MHRLLSFLLIGAPLLVGCGSAPSPSPAASPSVAATPAPTASESAVARPIELSASPDPLRPGQYTRSGFRPAITFELGDGWFAGTLDNGFFDVQQDRGTPDVIAVQFAVVRGVVGAEGATVNPETAAEAAAAIAQNPSLEVLGESGSTMSGLTGSNLELENSGEAHAGILDVSLGRLGIDPGRRLWISLFDTPDGLLAIMVGGSVAQWDRALTTAEPVLESVVIGDGRAAPDLAPS